MDTSPISTAINNVIFVNDELAQRFAPKRLRQSGKFLTLGHILAAMPSLVLFMPLIIIYIQTRGAFLSILFFTLLACEVVASISLVSYSKEKVVSIVKELEKITKQGQINNLTENIIVSLSPTKQILSGSISALLITLLAQVSGTLQRSDWWIRLSASFGVAYAAFLVGVVVYIVLCIPRIFGILPSINFYIHNLFPYQSIELRHIANHGASISLFGAIIAMVLTSLIITLTIFGGAYKSYYWTTLVIGVLVLSWITVSIPFVASQIMSRQIIRQAKEVTLSQLALVIRNTFDHIDNTDNEAMEQLRKLQELFDQIYKSPGTILDWGILGKYFSSLLLTLIPTIIGAILQYALN